jgi:hypothetical protein
MTKKAMIALATFLGGFFYMLVFFLPAKMRIAGHTIDTIKDVRNLADEILIVAGLAVIGVGLIQIFLNYGRHIVRLHKGWYNSLALFIAMFMMLSAGIWSRMNPDNITANEVYDILYKYMFVSLGAAMFSLLSFYIATAAYRSFRVRSFEAAFMMAAALLIMVGQIPLGEYISQWTNQWANIPEWRNWVIKNISTPAFQGIAIGATVAGLAMSLRIWLSIERGTFFD